jgi:hypothetical protein
MNIAERGVREPIKPITTFDPPKALTYRLKYGKVMNLVIVFNTLLKVKMRKFPSNSSLKVDI